MKILVLLPDSPDPWSNTAARYYGPVLRALAGLGHAMTVLAIRRPGENGLAYFDGAGIRFRLFDPPAPRPLLERKLRSLWRSGWELTVSDFGHAAREETRRGYDAILAEMPETARVVENDPRTLLSLHHLRFQDLVRLNGKDPVARTVERAQAKRAELTACRRAPFIRATSQRLACLARKHGVKAPIEVVPICVDPGLYPRVSAPPVPTVGVLGSMFWAPSRRAAEHFVREIVPKIRAEDRHVRFLVGGWQAKKFLSHAVKGTDVEILDSFPSPAEAFSRLSVLVYAPPVGTGMKVKVLEAMAYGVPAVVNAEGFEGLDADSSPPVRLANNDDGIVKGVLQFLHDPHAREWAVEEGRCCIRRSFSPDVVARALGELLGRRRGCVASPVARPSNPE